MTGPWCWWPGTGSPIDFTGAQPPPGYQLIDLGEATLLPGLIDTHMHLVFDASTDPAGHLQAVSDETLLAEARGFPPGTRCGCHLRARPG
jgi:imidazolonepropionase-like amidohydrolase